VGGLWKCHQMWHCDIKLSILRTIGSVIQCFNPCADYLNKNVEKVPFIFDVAGLEHDTDDVALGPVGGGSDGMLPEGLRRISEKRLDHIGGLVVSQHQSAEN